MVTALLHSHYNTDPHRLVNSKHVKHNHVDRALTHCHYNIDPQVTQAATRLLPELLTSSIVFNFCCCITHQEGKAGGFITYRVRSLTSIR